MSPKKSTGSFKDQERSLSPENISIDNSKLIIREQQPEDVQIVTSNFHL